MSGESQRAVNVIKTLIESNTGGAAKMNYTPGIVEEDFGSGYFCSVYVRAEDFLEEVEIPAGMAVTAGDYIMVAETGTGAAWVEYLLPQSDYSKLAFDFENRTILSGSGDSAPTAVIEFNDAGEMVDPTTGATIGGSPTSKVFDFNNFQ